ncbi:MAG: bifunctional (p)ppGpp synthetase/guanosine-3',5'-bis(diphosphate) 3'-pyrophosphohydrolase [Bacteroidales bacterium]|nr:bifunctional (p)ppGpp synthetase/guanosine-3',5'-bis(diphosphate) 3'-pyrophosphohydrolase [Bacteroidales bacterium]
MSGFTQDEKKAIEQEFDKILNVCPKCKKSPESLLLIRKAFDIANKAHYGTRRKSGEPYIFHPIEVAKIASGEIGLGSTAVICALLHDVVEDTDYTIEDMRMLFDDRVAMIIDGLTKIKASLKTPVEKAENFRKMLLTLSDDVRVILVKLADRLHNMRTLDSMARDKQLKIASETRFLFAPLAHRLGLYKIKTELEDLCLKYEQPIIYNDILKKLTDTEQKREHYLNRFCIPLVIKIEYEGFDYQIAGRPKSISSIWNKIRVKNINFEDIYDLFAVRIILNDIPLEEERTACWKIYTLVTDLYQPNPDRLRDWISTPKTNGYEALHTTVMGPEGRWVEVQIRTNRMDEIAERGYAAHWKYKGLNDSENQLDKWMKRLRDTLEDPNTDALEFLDEFKLNLFNTEIYVFTPKGELKRFPLGTTVLDFAYEIHSEIGNHAVGAKINRHKTVPLDYKLQSGDQVQIITSEKQQPQKKWIEIVCTAKAKNSLKNILKLEKKKNIMVGHHVILDKLREIDLKPSDKVFLKLVDGYNLVSENELFERAATNQLDFTQFEKHATEKRTTKIARFWRLQLSKALPISSEDAIVPKQVSFKIAECCCPIPGDKIIAFEEDGVYIVHKNTCLIAIEEQNWKPIQKFKWILDQKQSFLVRIKIIAKDRIGLLNDITKVISTQYNVNIRTVHTDSLGDEFRGILDLYVHDVKNMNNLMLRLQKVKGIDKVERMDKIDRLFNL